MSLDEHTNIENETIKGQPPPLTMLPDVSEDPVDIHKAISDLPTDTFILNPSECAVWEKLRVKFWGKDLGSLERELMVNRGDEPVSDDILPGKTPPTSCLVIQIPNPLRRLLRLTSRAIMVRSEYNQAEEAALTSSESSGLFVVTGTQGIGMTPFLSVDRR